MCPKQVSFIDKIIRWTFKKIGSVTPTNYNYDGQKYVHTNSFPKNVSFLLILNKYINKQTKKYLLLSLPDKIWRNKKIFILNKPKKLCYAFYYLIEYQGKFAEQWFYKHRYFPTWAWKSQIYQFRARCKNKMNHWSWTKHSLNWKSSYWNKTALY